jgi:hypothetical protein
MWFFFSPQRFLVRTLTELKKDKCSQGQNVTWEKPRVARANQDGSATAGGQAGGVALEEGVALDGVGGAFVGWT